MSVFEDSMRVPVETEFELGEQTKHRLEEMGARCVGETLDIEYYYDTDSFQLASTQTWLNQHNGQWGLILAEEQKLNHAQAYDTKKLEAGHSEEKKSKILNSSHEEKSETGAAFGETTSNESPEKVLDTSLTYTELSDPCSIMMHLSKCLQLPLTHTELKTMTMKNFLNLAQIQMYDSWTRTSTVKYSLPGGFSLVVERNYRIPTETASAFLMMNADVLSISSELEKMDRLCKDLGLKPKASSDGQL